MKPPRKRLRFAVDHNFPEPILEANADFVVAAELVPVRKIDPAFASLDDWELLLALFRSGEWDGLITNDDALLSLPKEMTVLDQTGLTLVVIKGQGDNPIRSMGILLCHIAHVCHHSEVGRPQIWRLQVSQKQHEPVRGYLEKIANRTNSTVDQLVAANRVSGVRRQ